jgi:hypothetical protein
MKQIFLIIGLMILLSSFSQDSKTIDFIDKAKEIDFSDLWTQDSILIENEKMIQHSQPLGYIGDNYQRFEIRFISVIKNTSNHLEYFVYGKTRVKDNICRFQGTIEITSASLYQESELSDAKQGFISGDYNFYEDIDQKHTGIFKGNFQTNFYIDSNGDLNYDALMWIADGFKNNQFEGTWTDYKTNQTKKCNWGDYRIPNSGNFDIGAAEFSPSSDYHQNGWLSYVLQHMMPNSAIVNQPTKEELIDKWWINCK